jgi:hypothetical protein
MSSQTLQENLYISEVDRENILKLTKELEFDVFRYVYPPEKEKGKYMNDHNILSTEEDLREYIVSDGSAPCKIYPYLATATWKNKHGKYREPDIKIIKCLDNKLWVVPNFGGVSTFNEKNERFRGGVWYCLPKGTLLPAVLDLVPSETSGNGALVHYSLVTTQPIRLYEFLKILKELSSKLEEVR